MKLNKANLMSCYKLLLALAELYKIREEPEMNFKLKSSINDLTGPKACAYRISSRRNIQLKEQILKGIESCITHRSSYILIIIEE